MWLGRVRVPRPLKGTRTLTLSASLTLTLTLTLTLALTLLHQVVCVDCDNTLWRGVVGEVDDLGLLLPNLPLQRALKARPHPRPHPHPHLHTPTPTLALP